jgi:hypothetical protein
VKALISRVNKAQKKISLSLKPSHFVDKEDSISDSGTSVSESSDSSEESEEEKVLEKKVEVKYFFGV